MTLLLYWYPSAVVLCYYTALVQYYEKNKHSENLLIETLCDPIYYFFIMEEEDKLPLKRVEISLTKFNEVAIPHHLDLLRQHKANIIKVTQ